MTCWHRQHRGKSKEVLELFAFLGVFLSLSLYFTCAFIQWFFKSGSRFFEATALPSPSLQAFIHSHIKLRIAIICIKIHIIPAIQFISTSIVSARKLAITMMCLKSNINCILVWRALQRWGYWVSSTWVMKGIKWWCPFPTLRIMCLLQSPLGNKVRA